MTHGNRTDEEQAGLSSGEGDTGSDDGQPGGKDSGVESTTPDDDEDDGEAHDANGESSTGSGGSGASLTHATPEEVQEALDKFMGHDKSEQSYEERVQDAQERTALEKAASQIGHFDEASTGCLGINVNKWNDRRPNRRKPIRDHSWRNDDITPAERVWQKDDLRDYAPIGEGLLSRALLAVRLAFSANKRNGREAGKKSGRVNSRALAKVAVGEDRVFTKRTMLDKRDYFISIGLDVSGSIEHEPRLEIECRTAMALANLFTRTGVKFAIYAHTSFGTLEMFEVKGPDEPWSDKLVDRLQALHGAASCMDGHAFEFLRKVCDGQKATNKMVMYFTDGQMPAANRTEELHVLQREIIHCNKRGIKILGVGIQSDAPMQHGLDTVQLDEPEDIIMLIKEMERRLA